MDIVGMQGVELCDTLEQFCEKVGVDFSVDAYKHAYVTDVALNEMRKSVPRNVAVVKTDVKSVVEDDVRIYTSVYLVHCRRGFIYACQLR